MKIQYKTLLLTLGAVAVLTSCEKNDPLESVVEPGQKVPTAYWEVGSTACKAGESFTFQGKYTVDYEGASPSYSEVWYRVVRDESAAATVKLGGASLNYTKTVADNQVMRSYHPIARFSHDLAEWAGHEFQITGSVPVSRTLKPVNWTDIATWDGDRFNQYYPEGFADEFNNEVINLLTKDSTYYNALRQVYISHPFTMEQFAAANAKYKVNFPTNIDMTKEDNGAGEKSDLWFSTTQASEDAIIGWYYVTIDAAGNKIIHEVAKDVQKKEGINYYPVYDSAEWVFCRYDDDLGAIISTVRSAYIPAFKDLLASITFDQWIYDSANKVYKVEFSRKYSLEAQFRVYDSNGEEGIANDVRTISIN